MYMYISLALVFGLVWFGLLNVTLLYNELKAKL